jgi:hypothetical protein
MTRPEYQFLRRRWSLDDDAEALRRLMSAETEFTAEDRLHLLARWFVCGVLAPGQAPNDVRLVALPDAALAAITHSYERRLDQGMSLRRALVRAWQDYQRARRTTFPQEPDATRSERRDRKRWRRQSPRLDE